MFRFQCCGTGGAIPLPDRRLSSFCLHAEGRSFLFDCGEGTQVSLRELHAGFRRIDLLFLSHRHGDHLYGLPGLLLSMAASLRREPLLILGPRGIKKDVLALLSLCALPFSVDLLELGGRAEDRLYFKLEHRGTRLLAYEDPSEEGKASVLRRVLHADVEGALDRSFFRETDEKEKNGKDAAVSELEFETRFAGARRLSSPEAIRAWREHYPYDEYTERPMMDAAAEANLIVSCQAQKHRCPCLAYRLDFLRSPAFLPEKAKALGLPPREWKHLQAGHLVRGIRPEEVLDRPRPGFSFALITDTRPCPANRRFARKADLLISEATFGDDKDLPKAVQHRHMTFREAARQARELDVGALLLTHFSAAIKDPGTYLNLAREEFPDVRLAEDLLNFSFDYRSAKLSFFKEDSVEVAAKAETDAAGEPVGAKERVLSAPPTAPASNTLAENRERKETGLSASSETAPSADLAPLFSAADEEQLRAPLPSTERSVLLLGRRNLARLRAAKVAVIGLGGVGGFCAEALCRSHIGELLLLDKDCVSPSNLNRQLIAREDTVGKKKTELFAARLRRIRPDLRLRTEDRFITEDSDLSFLDDMDYVADCIDTVAGKIRLACYCAEKNIPLISCMGTARRSDPSRLIFTDLFKTEKDPLCRVMRRELRKRGLPSLEILCSTEMPLGVSPALFPGEKRLASLIFVPATAGLRLAQRIVSRLAPPMNEEERAREEDYYRALLAPRDTLPAEQENFGKSEATALSDQTSSC